ncbi:putative membrane protein [Burkholderia pseudomallei S13]|nr:putative membrane protein [Burkholderia pseudomallei S13]
MPHALQCDAARHGALTRNAEHARRDHRRRARSSRFTRASLFDRIGIVRSLSD